MEHPKPSKLIVLEPQPDFPGEDLTDHNAEIIGGYYLQHTPGLRGEAERLYDHQRTLFELAHLSLLLRGITIDNAPTEYRSFVQGFACYELIQTLVTSSAYDIDRGALRADLHLINSLNAPFIEIAERSVLWPFERPNTFRAIVMAGEALEESEAQLHARTIGAQLAFELQRPLFDLAE